MDDDEEYVSRAGKNVQPSTSHLRQQAQPSSQIPPAKNPVGRPPNSSLKYRKPNYSLAQTAASKKNATGKAITSDPTQPLTKKTKQRQSEHELAFRQTAMAIKQGNQGISKKLEVLKSLKDIDKRTNNAKLMNSVMKRSKGIRKPKSCQQPRICKASVQPIQFHCDACNEDFQTGQALGGHMSRVHPGQSNSYARKIQRREERTFDRELLRLAKIEHAQMYGEDTPLDRVKIRRFKRNLRTRILKGEYVEGYMGNV